MLAVSQLPSSQFLDKVAENLSHTNEDEFLTEDLEGKRVDLEALLEKAEYEEER